MTQVFDENNKVVPVTVVKAGPNVVTLIRTPERDGYSAVQLAYGEISPRKVNKPVTGQYAAAGVNPRRHLAELRLDDEAAAAEYEVGQELTAEIFADGAYVDVTGTSQGQGLRGHHEAPRLQGPGRQPRRPGGAPSSRLDRWLRHPGSGVQGHPHVGPDGQRPHHDAEPVGAQGRRRERRAVDQGRHPRPQRRTGRWSAAQSNEARSNGYQESEDRRPHPGRQEGRLRRAARRAVRRRAEHRADASGGDRAAGRRASGHALDQDPRRGLAVAARSRTGRRAPAAPVRVRRVRRSSPAVASCTARSRATTASGPRRR